MNLAEDKFYIGADSGGTKVEVLLISVTGKILKDFKFKGIHYSIAGPNKYSEALSEYILTAIKRSGLKIKNCVGLCIGLAGAREETDRKDLETIFLKKLKVRKILIATDAMTALYGAFNGKDGIILISGTGSVLYGFHENKVIRIGGWGRIIGDEGSGYWIGNKALNAVSKLFDIDENKIKHSSLCKKLNSEFGINKANLNDKIFKENFSIQSLAPIVIQLAEKRNKICVDIINIAVSDLMYHINTYLKVVKPKKTIGIALIGSLVENENILSRKLKKEIMKLKNVRTVEKKYSPAYGAYLMISGGSNLLTKI